MIQARYMSPALYDSKLMKPLHLGIDYGLGIFTGAIGGNLEQLEMEAA
jgi:hypothetical protein